MARQQRKQLVDKTVCNTTRNPCLFPEWKSHEHYQAGRIPRNTMGSQYLGNKQEMSVITGIKCLMSRIADMKREEILRQGELVAPDSLQPVPHATSAAVLLQMVAAGQVAEVLLQGVAAGAGQLDGIHHRDPPVFAGEFDDLQ